MCKANPLYKEEILFRKSFNNIEWEILFTERMKQMKIFNCMSIQVDNIQKVKKLQMKQRINKVIKRNREQLRCILF